MEDICRLKALVVFGGVKQGAQEQALEKRGRYFR